MVPTHKKHTRQLCLASALSFNSKLHYPSSAHTSVSFASPSLPVSQITALPGVTSVTGGFVSFPKQSSCGDRELKGLPDICGCASLSPLKSIKNHKGQPERWGIDGRQWKPISSWVWEHLGVQVNLAHKQGHARPSFGRSRRRPEHTIPSPWLSTQISSLGYSSKLIPAVGQLHSKEHFSPDLYLQAEP